MFALRPSSREHPVIPRFIVVAAPLALAACGGGPGTSAAGPAPSAEQAVRSFMQAAADSNLPRMAELWGTSAGPAAKTGQPPDYQRRLTIMQVYLSGAPYRLVPGGAAQIVPAGGDSGGRMPGPTDESNNTRQVVVELERTGCTKFVPFMVVKAADNSWVVNQVDLAAAGHPKRPCAPEKTAKDSTVKDST
jgi:hypothetical protein